MKTPLELRLEGLQKVYTAARREYEESFFSGDPARMVSAWDGEQRALANLLSIMAQPQPRAPSPEPQISPEPRAPSSERFGGSGLGARGSELTTTRRILDDAETDKTRPLPDLPDLSDLEALNDVDLPVTDRTSPLDPSALEMTEHDPVGPILRAMAQSQRKADRRQASGVSRDDEDGEDTAGRWPEKDER